MKVKLSQELKKKIGKDEIEIPEGAGEVYFSKDNKVVAKGKVVNNEVIETL